MMGVAPEKARSPAGAQQAGGFRHGGIRIGERHGPVVAEDDVEALVGKGHGLRARVNKREVHPGFRHQAARVGQLVLGEIKRHRLGAGLGQSDRPLGGAASQLEDVAAFHLAEDSQLALGHLPYSPGQAPRSGQLRAVVGLIGVAVGVPALPVARRMIGERLRIQFWDIQHAFSPPWVELVG